MQILPSEQRRTRRKPEHFLWRRPGRIPSRANASLRPWIEALEDRCLLSGDAVLHWNSVGLEATRIDHGVGFPTQQFGPTRQTRALAIEQIAIYDAVCAIDGTYQSYLPMAAADPNASLDAAVAQAGHDTLAVLFSNQKAVIDQALVEDLAAIPDGPAKSAGIAVGQAAASQILAARLNDGSQVDAVGQPVNYTYGQLPGQWRADPLHPNAQPLTPDWGSVTPFVLTNGSQFRAPPPPALDSPEYTAAYNEVKTLGGSSPSSPTTRSDQQTIIGLFWGYDAQPGLCAPARFYNQIAQVIAKQEGNTEVQNARLFFLINVAMADAAIACWETKYYYNFWRPITAIRESDPGTGPSGLGDGNPNTIGDPLWTPLGAPADNNNGTNFTPPFPSYVSGHASIGGSMFRMLADFYGTDNISFTIISDEFNTITIDQNGQPRPLEPRSYTSFSQAADENGESRIYLGIHFNFDKVQGIKQGDAVADYVFGKVGQIALDANQAYINKLYRDVLGRRADAYGLAAWDTLVKQGWTQTQVAAGILNSAESHRDQVNQLYLELLHRQADAAGLAAFSQFLDEGGSLVQAETFIMGSQEYFTNRGGGTNAGFLAAVYADVLNRPVDAFGAAAFGQMLQTGASTLTVAATILTAPEARQNEVRMMYQRFLHRDPDLAGSNAFCNALEAGMQDALVEAIIMGSVEYASHI